MRYKNFIIANYRGITGPLVISISKDKIVPIIGVNESGKTTVLQALFAFDYTNDSLNDGRHRKDTTNLYKLKSPNASVTAQIDLSITELKKFIGICEKEATMSSLKSSLASLGRRKKLTEGALIRRDLVTGKYQFVNSNQFLNSTIPLALHDVLARKIVSYLPYILYFDDFRDKVDNKIPIPPAATDHDDLDDWQAIIEQLFIETNPDFSMLELPGMEERQRKTVLSKVKRHLNNTLTKQWQAFRLDNRDALTISIDYHQENGSNYLKLDVVETDENGDEHFFFISDRSKGFYWFFNFVMKLEFNPKLTADSDHTIYLLDEPGSYLHAFAQRKLCQKLKHISGKNVVLYCTHSHYLLDPEVIPISNIVIADRDSSDSITLTRMIDYKGSLDTKRSALQPVLDALQIRPYSVDLISDGVTVIVEGINDYLALDMFKGKRQINILPSVNADSIKFYVSFMIAWQVPFRALWDHDDEGLNKLDQAREIFGEEVAKKFFKALPASSAASKRILQNLFEGADISLVRESLGLPTNCSFSKTIQVWYYSPKKDSILAAISEKTNENFASLFAHLDV